MLSDHSITEKQRQQARSLSDREVSAFVRPPSQEHDHEIDLLYILAVIWRRKFLILCISLLPTLGGGLVMQLLPKTYSLTYQFKNPVPADQLFFLKEYFWGRHNIGRLCQVFRTNGFPDFADELEKSHSSKSKKINFGLRTFKKAEGDLHVSVSYLEVTVRSGNQETLPKIGTIIQENVSMFLFLDTFLNTISDEIESLREKADQFSKDDLLQSYQLDQQKSILERLQGLQPKGLSTSPDVSFLHSFPLSDNSEPLSSPPR